MNGIEKVIEELGLIILSKNAKLKLQQEEIEKLQRKLDTIESYLDAYDNFYNHDNSLKN